MKEFQRCKNEENSFVTHETIEMRRKKQRERHRIIVKFIIFDEYRSSHLKNSMRCRRICFIFTALKFFHWRLQRSDFHILSYCCIDVCLSTSTACCLMIELWATFGSWFFAISRSHYYCLPHCFFLRISIASCVMNEFSSFL